MRWLVGKNLVPGTIVILHDGISDPSRSIEALPQILTAGRKKGLRFTSIGALVREAAGARMQGIHRKERANRKSK